MRDALAANGRKKVVVAGLWTEVCNTTFALCAMLEGDYEIYMVADASGGTSKEAHDYAMQRMVQAGVVPVTRQQVMLEWQRDWKNRETYDEVMAVAKEHSGAYGMGIDYACYDGPQGRATHGNRARIAGSRARAGDRALMPARRPVILGAHTMIPVGRVASIALPWDAGWPSAPPAWRRQRSLPPRCSSDRAVRGNPSPRTCPCTTSTDGHAAGGCLPPSALPHRPSARDRALTRPRRPFTGGISTMSANVNASSPTAASRDPSLWEPCRAPILLPSWAAPSTRSALSRWWASPRTSPETGARGSGLSSRRGRLMDQAGRHPALYRHGRHQQDAD